MEKHRRKVLFVINSLAGGGAERVILSLIDASREMLHEFDIVLALLDIDDRKYDVPDWLSIYQLDSRFGTARSIIQLFNLVRTLRPSATVSFLTRSNIANIASSKMLGVKSIISERVNTTNHFSGRQISNIISKIFIKSFYPHADHIIAVSNGIADDLQENFGIPSSSVSVITNPVNVARICSAASEPVVLPVDGPFIVAISRLSRNKNAVLAVEALAMSKLDLPLIILGEGPEKDAILDRAAALGIAKQVILPGFVPNPYPILRAACCYICPSNAEGFPNGLVEALALGVPTISTNCPSGPSEILADHSRETISGIFAGAYGTLVPQEDPAAMAEALHATLMPERVALLAEAGPRRAASYSVELARDRYWDKIRSVLS